MTEREIIQAINSVYLTTNSREEARERAETLYGMLRAKRAH